MFSMQHCASVHAIRPQSMDSAFFFLDMPGLQRWFEHTVASQHSDTVHSLASHPLHCTICAARFNTHPELADVAEQIVNSGLSHVATQQVCIVQWLA